VPSVLAACAAAGSGPALASVVGRDLAAGPMLLVSTATAGLVAGAVVLLLDPVVRSWLGHARQTLRRARVTRAG
jgi:hypothetical protein